MVRVVECVVLVGGIIVSNGVAGLISFGVIFWGVVVRAVVVKGGQAYHKSFRSTFLFSVVL